MHARRADLTELMDDPAIDRADLATSLRFIRRVNRHLGGAHAVMRHLAAWSHAWPAPAPGGDAPITILDVATGSADIPLAILEWAARQAGDGKQVAITALDLHETTLSLAREYVAQAWKGARPPRINFVRGDALALPFGDGAFDYAISSMFFHHLSDVQAIAALREMIRVSRRGVIVNDLLRTRFALAGIRLLTLLADRIDKHDARLSVRRAWTRAEVSAWPAAVNAPWLRYTYHFPARFTLAGERVTLIR